MKSSEHCGVTGCWYEVKTKGLCGSHYHEHRKQGFHQQVVANNEINRLLLVPKLSLSTLEVRHRTFARSLPIDKKTQILLTKSLNKAAINLGVVK